MLGSSQTQIVGYWNDGGTVCAGCGEPTEDAQPITRYEAESQPNTPDEVYRCDDCGRPIGWSEGELARWEAEIARDEWVSSRKALARRLEKLVQTAGRNALDHGFGPEGARLVRRAERVDALRERILARIEATD